MIRVVVAEDSLTARELLVEIFASDPEIQVVGTAKNGAEAVALAERLMPDVITMDVHMPVMDGLEATKEIMATVPTPIIIVSSSTSRDNVHLSFDAVRVGALMVAPKPDDPRSAEFAARREQLLAMTHAMSQVKVVRRWPHRPPVARPTPAMLSAVRPSRIVAIAASTGGPAALQQIFGALPNNFAAPVLVVQHMAHGFMSGFVQWLSTGSGLRVKVAEPGEPLVARTVFLPPEERHLGATSDGRVIVSDAPPIHGFRPSANFLFDSVARAFGNSSLAVILTGMGNDGVDGLAAVKSAGGKVIAQDEATSVVYGMPHEAVIAGVVDAVAPLDDIAGMLTSLAGSRL